VRRIPRRHPERHRAEVALPPQLLFSICEIRASCASAIRAKARMSVASSSVTSASLPIESFQPRIWPDRSPMLAVFSPICRS
jgi:hypothetical protein